MEKISDKLTIIAAIILGGIFGAALILFLSTITSIVLTVKP